jgi:tetratricopeptide (TPR) repeat protein
MNRQNKNSHAKTQRRKAAFFASWRLCVKRSLLAAALFLSVVPVLSAQPSRAPLPDEKGIVAEAEKKLAADPTNVELVLALGKAQSDLRRFEDAIATYTQGLEVNPDEPRLYLNRGHRHITMRRFDQALRDLNNAKLFDPKTVEVWYHIGLVHYFRGDFNKALPVWEQTREMSKTDDQIASSSDWLYMTLRRLGKTEEAAKVLEGISKGMKITGSPFYHQRLLFYKGLKKESEIFDPAKAGDLELATVGYGLGNWHLYNGNPAKAKEYFLKIVAGTYWPAFGFIAAEQELARMK